MIEKIKFILGLSGFIICVLVIIIVSQIRKDNKQKLESNPCYTECLSLTLKRATKGGKYIKYTYKVNRKLFKGSNYYIEGSSRSKYDYKILYVCNEPKISEIVLR